MGQIASNITINFEFNNLLPNIHACLCACFVVNLQTHFILRDLVRRSIGECSVSFKPLF